MAESLTIDARGLACPQPVLETKRALEEERDATSFTVLVDNYTSKENVSRFAKNQGCKVEVRENGSQQFEIKITRTGLPPKEDPQELLACPAPMTAQSKDVVYIGTDCMGKGDDKLGAMLMRGFLRTLIDIEPKPWRMIFINSGVKLTTLDEEATEAIGLLEEKGVEILSCGTCLEFFGLKDKLRVGKITNMFEVIDSLYKATKVISPD